MPRPKSYFGEADELREIRERRNEEIRAWGKQQLEAADAVLLGVPDGPLDVSDWDQIAGEEEDTVVAETPELSQEIADVPSEKTTPKPRTPPKPKTE